MQTGSNPSVGLAGAGATAAAQAHPHAAQLGEVAAIVAAWAADARVRHPAAGVVDESAKRVGLDRASAQSDFGDVLAILERGAEDPAERAIVGAFVAIGVASAVAREPATAKKWGPRLCYLAAHGGIDALVALPADASSDDLRPLFVALADHARAIEAGKAASSDRAELIVAAAALADAVERFSDDVELAQLASRLGADLRDATAVRILTAGNADAPSTQVQSGPSSGRIVGLLAPAPRSPLLTIAQALSGWMLLRALWTLVATHALGLQRPARVDLTSTGVEVKGRVVLLGRELRTINQLFPVQGIASVARDVRFPSLHLYAGLLSLVVGAYFGVTMLAWGVRSASIRLIAYGLLALVAGIVIDLLAVAVVPGARGKCRVVIVPKRGPTVCVTDVEIAGAERLLHDLARRT